jgi:hypothetical protein
MVNAVKTPIVVHVRAGHEQQQRGQHGQHDDPVGEHQPVAALGEPAGQERVLGHEAGQEREPVEARVAAGVEDQRGRGLHEDVHGPADY